MIAILALAGVTFFYKLGQSSLISWDEAWYGEIAKNILKTGDFFRLTFNGSPFYDHPPVGFWMMTLSMKFLGTNEIGVRAASAISGIIAVFLTYLIGKKLFNKSVGLASSFALISSPWFTLRARSGNLDIFLTMFFGLSFVLTLQSRTHPKFLLPLSASLGLMFLTKSMVPLTFFPVLILMLWDTKIGLKNIIMMTTLFLTIIGIWALPQYLISLSFNFVQRYFMIGLPGINSNSPLISNILLTKTYLHNGIGIWFRPAIASLVLGSAMFPKAFLWLFVFLATFLFPFAFSSKGHIWHLIPVHPFLLITLFGFIYLLVRKLANSVALATAIVFTLALYLGIPQMQKNWNEFIDIPAFVSDEAILSREAKKYSQPFIIDESFSPAAAFYSDKSVYYTNAPSLQEIFTRYPQFVLITHNWRLIRDSINSKDYSIIKKDRDRVLIRKLN